MPDLAEHFDAEEKGEYKADICRVAALYEMGGYYFDVDLEVVSPFVATPNVSFATCREAHHPGLEPKFFQAFLAATRGHPVLAEALRTMLKYYKGDYHMQDNKYALMGTSTLADAFFGLPASAIGSFVLLSEARLVAPGFLNHMTRTMITANDVPLQVGAGHSCNFVVASPSGSDMGTWRVHFYSRIVGASSSCALPGSDLARKAFKEKKYSLEPSGERKRDPGPKQMAKVKITHSPKLPLPTGPMVDWKVSACFFALCAVAWVYKAIGRRSPSRCSPARAHRATGLGRDSRLQF